MDRIHAYSPNSEYILHNSPSWQGGSGKMDCRMVGSAAILKEKGIVEAHG